MKSYYHAGLFAFAFLALAFYLTSKDGCILQVQEAREEHPSARIEERTTDKEEQATLYQKKEIPVKDTTTSCNLFSGRWVFDNVSYPLYKEHQCPFMPSDLTDFTCERHGRKDTKYQHWRWQPHHCDLPRFNGTKLLEKLRGKKLVFVGDSVGRNQWTSLLCLIDSSLPESSNKSYSRDDNLLFFHSDEYNATIAFYWSPFLVESNLDSPLNHSFPGRIVRISAIDRHGRNWNDADILIFDNYIWWLDRTMTIIFGSFESPDAIYKNITMILRRYEMALETWSNWLEINIDRSRTKLFFTSLSPIHTFQHRHFVRECCYKETEPIMEEGYVGISTNVYMMRIAESIIQKLQTRGVSVEYLNITSLSDRRKDAHPSIYRDLPRPLTEEQLRHPRGVSDCLHWCLPGVPDTWNEILYSFIIKSS